MSDPVIIEAAARAMCDRPHLLRGWDDTPEKARDWYRQLALNAITVVTPLIEEAYVRSRATIHVAAIRNAALEEAAQIAEKHRKADRQFLPSDPRLAQDRIAAAIRALKEQP